MTVMKEHAHYLAPRVCPMLGWPAGLAPRWEAARAAAVKMSRTGSSARHRRTCTVALACRAQRTAGRPGYAFIPGWCARRAEAMPAQRNWSMPCENHDGRNGRWKLASDGQSRVDEPASAGPLQAKGRRLNGRVPLSAGRGDELHSWHCANARAPHDTLSKRARAGGEVARGVARGSPRRMPFVDCAGQKRDGRASPRWSGRGKERRPASGG